SQSLMSLKLPGGPFQVADLVGEWFARLIFCFGDKFVAFGGVLLDVLFKYTYLGGLFRLQLGVALAVQPRLDRFSLLGAAGHVPLAIERAAAVSQPFD